MLKWAYANGCQWSSFEFFIDAITGPGSKEVLEWALAYGLPLPTQACLFAAGTGKVAVLACVRAHGGQWDASVCRAAAGGGHLDALNYLLENGCECDVPRLQIFLEEILAPLPNTIHYIFQQPITSEMRKRIELTLQWLKSHPCASKKIMC